jgi:tetratricopeptide (TPR) repeat protein
VSRDDAETHNNRGNALRDLRRYAEALASYDQAIALRPDYAAAHSNRGNALRDLRRHEAALASYDTAIALQPDLAEAHNNRGNALGDLGRYEAALASYDKAIALQPDYAQAHYNRGNALLDLGRSEAALASYDKAIALKPDLGEARSNLGIVLFDLQRHEEALVSYDAAIALNPDLAEAHYNRALCLLQLGQFERGWQRYECRNNRADPIAHRYPQPLWLGQQDIAGKTLFIHWEQGLGDTLQFCRYAKLVKALGAQVIMSVQDPLLRLLRQMEPAIQLIGDDQKPAAFDYHCPLMSLPLAMGTTLETIPSTVPYLHADPERSAVWRKRLAALPGLKVGLVWAGAPRPEVFQFSEVVDSRRSITLNHYAPLASIPGLCLISLQKGEPAAQARTPPNGMVLHDWAEELDDFADTAALVEALDLVISVDTSVLHLVGALGKPVWVLNRYNQCWRWLSGRRDSPWYPSARLFRQPKMGNWEAVIDQVQRELHGMIDGGART